MRNPTRVSFHFALLAALLSACLGSSQKSPPLQPLDSPGVSLDVPALADAADAVALPHDVPAPNECLAGARRCFAEWVLECVDGAWAKLQDCEATGGCVDGECVCTPSCDGKLCGGDGCGGSCGTCADGWTCDAAAGSCTPPALYTAVLVHGLWNGNCSSYNSPGADLRGASLQDAQGQHLGYWDEVVSNPATEPCQNNYTNTDAVIGPPSNAQLSLQGGWVAGSFEGKNALVPGYTFTIYEFDGELGGSAEPFEVFLAPDLSCPGGQGLDDPCLFRLDEGVGSTTFLVPAVAGGE